jgi:hypothetical protein
MDFSSRVRACVFLLAFVAVGARAQTDSPLAQTDSPLAPRSLPQAESLDVPANDRLFERGIPITPLSLSPDG